MIQKQNSLQNNCKCMNKIKSNHIDTFMCECFSFMSSPRKNRLSIIKKTDDPNETLNKDLNFKKIDDI